MNVDSGFLGTLQTWVPVLGGFGVLVWLVWRLFWKVDMRSQQEIAAKNNEITKLKKEADDERANRLKAEERASRAESRERSMEFSISDMKNELTGLRDQLKEQNELIVKLQNQIRTSLNVDNARGSRPHLRDQSEG